jgi:hypothetical protein
LILDFALAVGECCAGAPNVHKSSFGRQFFKRAVYRTTRSFITEVFTMTTQFVSGQRHMLDLPPTCTKCRTLGPVPASSAGLCGTLGGCAENGDVATLERRQHTAGAAGSCGGCSTLKKLEALKAKLGLPNESILTDIGGVRVDDFALAPDAPIAGGIRVDKM